MGMNLDQWRIQQGLTYAALAVRIGVSKMQARRYCLREQIPERNRMRRIWQVTGGVVRPDSFYDMEEWADEAA